MLPVFNIYDFRSESNERFCYYGWMPGQKLRRKGVLEVTIQHPDIALLLGLSDKQIVGHLLSGYKGKFPPFDRFAVGKGDNSITCDFFQGNVKGARIKVIPVRFS